ncbi:MAG: DUF4026 domain-containing protein [Ruminococcus sp.]|nr:DUF4026 domain-containing protein [Ruminococcus sp.]
MKSGIIKKTTSYIMGIPMNDMDINTPQMIYDRIAGSSEFELKDVSFDDKNICPMLTVVYKDMEFIVDVKIEPVSAIEPDFMLCHPMPDSSVKKIKQAQIGITTSMTFNDDILASHHFQLKFLDCILPEAAAVVDFNVRRIFSPVWLKKTAASSVAPGPSYIFSVNVAPDKNDKSWIFTQGLNRCGFMELEVINADNSNIDFYASAMSIASSKAISERVFPSEMEPFEIAKLGDDKKLSVTWRFWKGEMSAYPQDCLGVGKKRPKSQSMFNGVLFIWPDDGKSKKPVRANELAPFCMDKAVIEYSAEESLRIEALAKETLPALAKGLTLPESKALVKIKTVSSGDSEGNVNFEYIWAEADRIDEENIYCTAVHDTLFSKEITNGEKFQTSIKNISDWILNLRGTRIAPDNAFLLEN